MPKETFIEMCLNGSICIKSIDDHIDEYIDTWHECDTKNDLHEYLGMTKEEYEWWVLDNKALPLIINARKIDNLINEIEKK